MLKGRTTEQPTNVRTVILAKGDMLGLFSLATFPSKIQIVTIDPRESEPAVRHYDSPEAAKAVFDDLLQATIRNGWSIAYDGPQLHG